MDIQRDIASDMGSLFDAPYPSSGGLTTTFSPTQVEADRSVFTQLQRFYRSCVQNTPALGMRDLQAVANSITELYPACKNSQTTLRCDAEADTSVAMGRTLAYMAKNGFA